MSPAGIKADRLGLTTREQATLLLPPGWATLETVALRRRSLLMDSKDSNGKFIFNALGVRVL